MNDRLPPQCEELYQTQKAAEREHLAAWDDHAALLVEFGLQAGQVTVITQEQREELERRTARLEHALVDWNRKLAAWIRACGGMRFRLDE
jgi:hypothetical protein